jgi:hypothetical protein
MWVALILFLSATPSSELFILFRSQRSCLKTDMPTISPISKAALRTLFDITVNFPGGSWPSS